MADDAAPKPAIRPTITTERKRADYLAAYDAVLAQWPVPVESVDLKSPYGTTHVQICGPREGTPLVLLHGGGATSTVWFANVGQLSQIHRVYAVDVIGQAGRSINDGRAVDSVAAFMDWLDGVFSDLTLERARLCGHSYGAWLALNYALHAPHRVHKLALLDPTDCFVGLKLSYRLHAVPLFARPSAERMRTFMHWETAGMPVDPAWLKVLCLGVELPRTKLVIPRHPAPERLRASTVPTLLLLAEKTRAHDIHKLSTNARKLMPDIVTAVLLGASHHTIPIENAAQLNRELDKFFG